MYDLLMISRSSLLIHSRLQTDALSELFVAWDNVLAETENKVMRLERNREERHRLGYE